MTENESKPAQPLLVFPCDFIVKVFGMPSAAFEELVIAIVLKQDPHYDRKTLTQRPSKDGKYVAYSLLVHVQNQTQIDDIYRDLTASPLVLMAL